MLNFGLPRGHAQELGQLAYMYMYKDLFIVILGDKIQNPSKGIVTYS